jgi:hypothetical protein
VAPVVQISKMVDRNGAEIPVNGTTQSSYMQMTFKATDAVGVSNTQCILDGQTNRSCISSLDYDHLEKGIHKFIIRGSDAAGNIEYASFTVRVEPINGGEAGGGDTQGTTPSPGTQSEAGGKGTTVKLPEIGPWSLWSQNTILMATITSGVIVGIVVVNHKLKDIRSRIKKIAPSAIVEIKAKGGMK